MRAVDITGQRFGRLVALRDAGSRRGSRLWECRCDCGSLFLATGKAMKSGNTLSCGCLVKDAVVARNKASATHGMTGSPEFITWDSMKQRCLNPKHKSFPEYGGRGISVCPEWLSSFQQFYADMGPRPKGMTLERNDTNGNYEKGNCRWATPVEQGNNRRTNVSLTFSGKTQTVAEWARELGIGPKTLANRLKQNWTLEEALTMKVDHGNGWTRGAR
jgi:hypothetical protein